ncbi:MFS transporter [Streptomyces sp. NPDC058985]|uniref:MFS transporter n=1 Tax=Streptomyces sp. NPDC058985 TaxID=3346684 RepID=UPI0036A462E7
MTVFAAGVLHLLWFRFLADSGGDLAAHDAWAGFADRHPDSAYTFAWYGGMHPMSYSVISPYLMAAVGVRTTVMVSGTLSAGLVAFILVRCGWVHRPLVPALWGAVALVGNAASGRATFAVGLLFGLGAVALVYCPRHCAGRADSRWRWAWRFQLPAVMLLSTLATLGSPVAGLFLAVVGGALILQARYATGLALLLPLPGVVSLSVWLFPFSGVQPLALTTAIVPLLFTVAVACTALPQWRTVRLGAVVYGLGTVATWLVPSPVGSNVERLALLFGGIVLLAAAPHHRGGGRVWRRPRALVVWLALAGAVAWTLNKTVSDIVLTVPDSAWTRGLSPLVEQLERRDAEGGRVEVVPTRSHREASALVPYVNLARGWNRQADTERHGLFYDGTLTAENYRTWLDRWAVRYVVLPRGDRPDIGAKEEADLVASGLPYLTEVWSDANWRLFRVSGPKPLADSPATAVRADESEVVVSVKSAGPVLVRIAWSPWLAVVDADGKRVDTGNGCLTGTGEWTILKAPRPGEYRIAAPYGLRRGTSCP